MFHELRTTRSGWTPLEVCASSRPFRWHRQHRRTPFGFAAGMQEEFHGIAVPVSPRFVREIDSFFENVHDFIVGPSNHKTQS
jgi:hypothetical protein